MATKKLSDKQGRMLDFLRSFLEGHNYPPTVRDIQRGCGISSTSVVDYNLHILQREGHIRRSPDISRGIELLEPPRTPRAVLPEVFSVPVLGTIAAGQPLPVFADSPAQEATETVKVPLSMVHGAGPLYALKVKGSSMIDALIDDGDVVLLEPATEVRNGEMVAVWLKAEKEATLKRFYREPDRVRLQPANSQMKPIYVAPENVEIQGRVVGVLRQVS
ncbi:MAG: transcriptional repressor LexA [Chloroflexi bacterium]|nr:transcriptional repressor LexA [Chloroflexota bacterium]